MNQVTEPLFHQGWRLLRQNRWLFLSFVMAGSVAGIAMSYLFVPVFKADALLVPSDETLGLGQSDIVGGLSGIASLVGVGGLQETKASEALAVLKSRALVLSFIQAHALLPILFHDRWDASLQEWKSTRATPTLADGFREFDNGIRTVIENRKTNLINISITWEDPKVAKEWVDGLVDAANAQIRREAIERSTKNLAYLQSALERTSIVGVKDAISKVMESEIKKQMMAVGNIDYAFRVVDPAVVPERKVFPKRSIFTALGAAAGTMAWLIAVVLKGGD